MGFQLVLFAVLSLLITLVYMATTKSNDQLQLRKEQSDGRLRENVLRKRLEKIAEERVKFSKRYGIETLMLQAGMRSGYVEYVAVSIASALLFSIVMFIALNNIILGFVFLGIGYMVPKQVLMFLKNRRVGLMDKQIGSFMLMILKRYENTKDFKASLELTMKEFKGEEPLYSEIRQTVMDVNLGMPMAEALSGMARRTGNKFMVRLADYYQISSDIGTDDVRKKLLQQAYLQYEENRRGVSLMKRELSGVKREAYIMLGAVPVFAIFQMNSNDDFIDFMTGTTLGQGGTVAIFVILAGCVWFINNKISAPLD